MYPSRIVHKAAKINDRGGVSALCFAKPRSINLKAASWTLQNSFVTCIKCRELLALDK